MSSSVGLAWDTHAYTRLWHEDIHAGNTPDIKEKLIFKNNYVSCKSAPESSAAPFKDVSE